MSLSKRVYGLAGWRKSKARPGLVLYTLYAGDGLASWVSYIMAVAEGELMAMSRSKSASESPGLQWMDEVFALEHPDLYEFLAESMWDDGKKRSTGTLIIASDGRSIKAKVCDRDGKRGAWVTADTFSDLLRRIDIALHNDDLDWRKETR